MSKRIYATLVLCLACLSALVACAGADNTNGANTSNANANANANANRAAATPAAATPAATVAAAGDQIGVAECDDYLAKVDDCITTKVPEAARAQYNSSIEQTRKSWRDLAANPQTRASLAAACKQAVESARAAYKSFGCEF